MPQAVPFTIVDRAGSPASHVFTPGREDANGVWTFFNKAVEEPNCRERFSVKVAETSRRVVKLRLIMPVKGTETINGVSQSIILRESVADVEFRFDAMSTTQERKDLVGLIEKSLGTANTLFNTVLTDFEELY